MSRRTAKKCPKLHCLGDFIDIVDQLGQQGRSAVRWSEDSGDDEATATWRTVLDRIDILHAELTTIRDSGGRLGVRKGNTQWQQHTYSLAKTAGTTWAR